MVIFNNMFVVPEIISPFYGNIRIPRKLKKKVKKWSGVHWNELTNGQRLWYYLEKTNPKYRDFIISKICKKYERERRN